VQSIARVPASSLDAPLAPADVVFVLHAAPGEPLWSGFGAGRPQQYPAGSLIVCADTNSHIELVLSSYVRTGDPPTLLTLLIQSSLAGTLFYYIMTSHSLMHVWDFPQPIVQPEEYDASGANSAWLHATAKVCIDRRRRASLPSL
jgi:hypothetical protein